MYYIKSPTLDWFMHGNVFTGSFGTDTTKGCLCQTTFNYKVKIVEDKHGKCLAAICYYKVEKKDGLKTVLIHTLQIYCRNFF